MEKNLLPKHNSQLSRNHYNTIYDRDLQNKIRIARLHWRTSTLRETLAQPFHCYLHRLDCTTHKNCNTLLWNTSLRYTSSNAQRVATHAKHNSTASTKNRKSHLEPSVPLHAQFETDSTAKRRRWQPSRKRANFCPQRTLCLPEKTQCFVQILTFKSHP